MQIDRDRLRALLRRDQRSQAWAARQTGKTRQTFQHYVNGRPLPMDTYVRLAAALGTTDFIITPAADEPQKAAA